MATEDKRPYANELQGSVLETTTILSQILRPFGYNKDVITDIAVGAFLENERCNIKLPSNMHLFSLKKTLLYAIPVIAPRDSQIGITLTSQVSSPAIQYSVKTNIFKHNGIATGDKYRLIGLSFPPALENHLSHDVFEWKFFNRHDYAPPPVDLSCFPEIKTTETNCGRIFIINPQHYENTDLFNRINVVISSKMMQKIENAYTSVQLQIPRRLHDLERISPFTKHAFVEKLNTVLQRQIYDTFSMAFFEACQMTANWLLYDQIMLLGFNSSEVQQNMTRLKYVKEQSIGVTQNSNLKNQQLLLRTKAEKIARERYPFYFDYTDSRVIFNKFKQFEIDRLPKKDRADVELLLQKDIAIQDAILHNHCDHTKCFKVFIDLKPFIDYDSLDDSGMYHCKLCSYPMVCIHKVELEEALSTIDKASDALDQTYRSYLMIINKFKSISRKRTGYEDTTVSYTFYCKFCGEELGKTDDNIQASHKTQADSSFAHDLVPNMTEIFQAIYAVVFNHMNDEKVPVGKKTLVKMLFEECQEHITRFIRHATKQQTKNIDIFIRYIATVFALVGLVSLNLNKFKTKTSIFKLSDKDNPGPDSHNDSSPNVKDELVTTLKIIQSIQIFKQIGIVEQNTRSLIINCFKQMNKTFSNEVYNFKSRGTREILVADIKYSPLPAYAAYMKWRQTGKHLDGMEASGVDFDELFNKKNVSANFHALYKNVFVPTSMESTDRGKYILESYLAIVNVAVQEPLKNKYISIVNPPLSNFVLAYQRALSAKIKATRVCPTKHLPESNGREYDFSLRNYQIAYCHNDDMIQPHRWMISKSKSSLLFVCKHCKLDINNASKSHNQSINEKLGEQMKKEAFFELYTLSCPIKDVHIFVSDTCSQCKVTKRGLVEMDASYYKTYSPIYAAYRETISKTILRASNSIVSYSVPYKPPTDHSPEIKPDALKLESLVSSLSKLYNHKDIQHIGVNLDGVRSVELLESYIRLFYSYYTFVKNISIDMKCHPDVAFMMFIKRQYFNGLRPKDIKLPELPPYPTSSYADSLLIVLLDTIHTLVGKGDSNELVKFILNKIVSQQSKRRKFNFSKLKAVHIWSIEDEMIQLQAPVDDEGDNEFDMFDGYDISRDDMEDNIDGEY